MRYLRNRLTKINFARYETEIWAATGIRTTLVTGSAVCSTFVSLYLYQDRHLPMTVVGLISLIAGLLLGVIQLGSGIVSDKVGHRRMLIICITAGFFVQAGLAVLIGLGGALWLIVILLIARQIVGGMGGPALSAIVADRSTQGGMTESYALMQIADNFGWGIGPLIGGYLLAVTSFAWLFGASALIGSLSIIFAVFLLKPAQGRSPGKINFRSLLTVTNNRRLMAFGAVCFLVFLVMAQWLGTLSVFATDRIGFTTQQFGLLITISSLIIVVFQYPIARNIEKFGISKALFLGGFFHGAGFLFFAWPHSYYLAIVAIAIIVTGEMFFIPTTQTVIGKMSRPEDRGKNMGFFGLCGALGWSFGSLLGGYLLDTFSSNSLFIWGPVGLIGFLAGLGFILWNKMYAQKEDAQSMVPEWK
jgi:MFS family permease